MNHINEYIPNGYKNWNEYNIAKNSVVRTIMVCTLSTILLGIGFFVGGI